MRWRVDLPGGGNLVTFGEALLACHASLYRYARALSRDPVAAEELLQETYGLALAAKKRPSLATEDNLRPWLFTIMRNRWYNQTRQHRKDVATDALREPDIACEETPETTVSRRLLQSEVRDAVDALPENYREVVVLRELENLTYAEISNLIGCPVGTVMSRLSRARALLRQLLVNIAPERKGVSPS